MLRNSLSHCVIYPQNALLLISGTNDDKRLPVIQDRFELYLNNTAAVYLSTANLVDDLDKPLRVLVGNITPKNSIKLFECKIETEKGNVYVGDVNTEAYMILSVGSKLEPVNIGVWSDSIEQASLIYLYIDSDTISLLDKQSLNDSDDAINEQIDAIGRKDGCHVCGKKNASEYIPHLLPSPEIDLTSERKWYPICRNDYAKYEVEANSCLQTLI